MTRNMKTTPKTYYFVKRTADVLLSIVIGVICLPILLVALLAIMAEDPSAGPIFVQERVGKDGTTFRMFKLRSMHAGAEDRIDSLLPLNEAGGVVFKMKNDPRVTKVGRILRKTYIDELPQLLNVLRGDMSLVGPRPPLPCEVAQYTRRQRQRLSVQQGLTCFWQITKNRYDLPFDECVDLDLKYIREQGIWTDVKILFGTLRAVLQMKGW